MKGKILSMFAFAVLLTSNAYSQDRKAYRTITDEQKGVTIEVGVKPERTTKSASATADGGEILWNQNEEYAIGKNVKIIESLNAFDVNWQLNDSRIAQYSVSGQLEHEVETAYDFTEMYSNGEGTTYAICDGSVVYIVDAASGEIILEKSMDGGDASYAVPTADGTGYYLAVNNRNGGNYYEYYLLNDDTPVWSKQCETTIVIMKTSDDNSKLVVFTSSALSQGIVVDPTNGETIQTLYYYNNSPTQEPGMSADGEYLAYADFSGLATLYKWNGSQYDMVWQSSIMGPGESSTWGQGSYVSPDGSTIVIGTLGFVSNGYSGSVFVFNNYSPEPIWSRHDFGDAVSNVCTNDDGSLIFAGTWGVVGNPVAPDLMVFRKQSSEPISTLATPGAAEHVDCNSDGSLCVLAGKAVHPREMGWGGQAYLVNPIPANMGNLAGVVDLEGTDLDYQALITIEGIDDYYEFSSENGEYLIKYIPEGTYNVTVSKAGYYPVTVEDVVISAQETTTLDVALEETGSPVQQLYATQGASNSVILSWKEYDGECIGFNIYRKMAEAEPYSTPLATIGNEQSVFEDVNVTPTMSYLYAVTAVISEGVESPFSEIVVGYPSTVEVTSEIDVYMATPATIDGIMDDAEWDDAFRFDASDILGSEGSAQPVGSVTIYVKTDGDYMYCAVVNHNDDTMTTGDRVAFYVDDNGNNSFEPSGDDTEGNYWMDFNADGTGMIRYRSIYDNGGVGETVTMENAMIACNDATGEVVMEFALPIGGADNWDIVPGDDNSSTMCLYVGNSTAPDRDGYWPITNKDYFNAINFGRMNFFVEDVAPGAPSNLALTDGFIEEYGFAAISWELPQVNDLDHCLVYLTSTQGGKETEVFEVCGSQFVFDVDNYTDYSIYVTAVDRTGHESEASNTITFATEGVENVDGDVLIYPNPANGFVNVQFNASAKTQMTIVDVNGRVVEKATFNGSVNERINVTNWKPGLYIVMLTSENGNVSVNKFIVK